MNHTPARKEKVFAGKAFSVERQFIALAPGHEAVFDVVIHPGAVTILPVDSQGNMWFVRQYRYGAGEDLLELPAGTLKAGEEPGLAAAREIREETGMAAQKMEKIGEFYMAPGYSSEYMHVYMASGLYASPLDQDEDEDLSIEKIPIPRAFEMARSGQIRDGKTLAVLLLAVNHPLLAL